MENEITNKYKIFDTHAHYDDEVYSKDLDEVLKKCFNAGVDKIVNVGYDILSSERSIELSKKYNQIYCAIGIHPHMATGNPVKDISEIERILKRETKKRKDCCNRRNRFRLSL